MLAVHFENVGVSAASMTVTCHPERSWGREATLTQSKDPEQTGAHAEAPGNSAWKVGRGENALQHSSGDHIRGGLRLRGRYASRIGHFAQDDC